MILEKQVLAIARSLIKKNKINCDIKFLTYNKFRFLAKKSPLIFQVLKEGFSFRELNLPAVIYHKNTDHIFICKEILEKLLKSQPKNNQKKFVEAIILHEIFHIKNRKKVPKFELDESINSEKNVFDKFKKSYPKLFKLSSKIINSKK
jgi:hypothetical protein